MLSSDIGSIPPRLERDKIRVGAARATGLIALLGVGDQEYRAFRDEVVSAFVDKLKAGVEVPNYPQFRDMNEMFLSLIEGAEKTGGGLVAVKTLRAKSGAAIPETEVLRREASIVREALGVEKVRVKACVTGPYTLASFFQHRTPGLLEELGECLASILRGSLFSNRTAEVAHVCVDEPVLGFMNDPLLDYGSEGREALRRAWENITGVAASHGIDTSMHLHNTSESLFWDVESLGSLTSHVGDPLYGQESTRGRLEETDKRLWATIGVTQFDTLIEAYHAAQGYGGNMPEKIGETWTGIRRGSVDPYMFLEEPGLMRKRLETVTRFFGVERIAYASPECGLSSFPGYHVAMECLRRVAGVVDEFNKSLGG